MLSIFFLLYKVTTVWLYSCLMIHSLIQRLNTTPSFPFLNITLSLCICKHVMYANNLILNMSYLYQSVIEEL